MILANMETCDLPSAIIPQMYDPDWKKAVPASDR